MDNLFFYNDMDEWWDDLSSSTSSSSSDEIVLRRLARNFYWEDGMPDFSLSYNRELLKQRMYDLAYTSVCLLWFRLELDAARRT